jgi:hypothetical protein
MYVEPNELYGLVDGEKVKSILQGSDKEWLQKNLKNKH